LEMRYATASDGDSPLGRLGRPLVPPLRDPGGHADSAAMSRHKIAAFADALRHDPITRVNSGAPTAVHITVSPRFVRVLVTP